MRRRAGWRRCLRSLAGGIGCAGGLAGAGACGLGERQRADGAAGGAQLRAAMAVEDVGLRRIVVAGFHERALYQVLDLLDLRCARCDEGLLHS